MNSKMTQKDIAKIIGKSEQTLINWKKNYPNLYKAVINYYNSDYNNFNIDKEEAELIKYFRNLTDNEKEMYLSEIKARVLRRELDEK